MIISELISKLEEMKNTYGDITVTIDSSLLNGGQMIIETVSYIPDSDSTFESVNID